MEETGVGTEIIFVNGLWRDNSDFGRIIHDFGYTDPKQMLDPVFAKRVAHVKSDKKCDAQKKISRAPSVHRRFKMSPDTHNSLAHINRIKARKIICVRNYSVN